MPLLAACQGEQEHTAAAINDSDSVSVMKTYGVNMLISDSGLIRYRMVAEEWEVNQAKTPSRWIFEKGLFLEQFDEQFHIEAYIQADTAYYYDQQKVWELHGRVSVRNVEGLRFTSEELFWDQTAHELHSNKFSRIVTPDREMEGTYFISDERMTRYTIDNSKGSFENMTEEKGEAADGKTGGATNDKADNVADNDTIEPPTKREPAKRTPQHH